MDCRLVREHLDAYVDNELEPTPVIEFERHLDMCSGCRNELALWRLIRQGVRQQPSVAPPPASLQLRVLDALDGADGRAVGRAKRWHQAGVGALGVAAAAALFVGANFRNWGTEVEPAGAGASTAATGAATASTALDSASGHKLLREIVAQHTDELPTEIAPDKPEELTRWFRGKLTFRVRSVEFAEPRAQMIGARVSYIGSQRAAKLYYRVGDSRVTVMAFPADAAAKQLRRALRDENQARRLRLRRTQIGNRVLTYDNVQNYTVPIFEHNGVVYAVTGDMDQPSLLRLVGSAHVP